MTIFKSIIEKNKRKSIEEYFQRFIKDLYYLQHELNAKLCINKFIHNKLINTYQIIFAYQYACFKSANCLADLINDLYSFIIIFQKANLNNI